MRHYNNDPSYKILPPRKMNASFANGPDADRYEVKAVLLIKSDYTPQPNKTTKTVSVEASSEAEAKSKAEKLVMYGESRDKVVSVDYVSVKKLFTGYRNSSDSFANGRQRATNAISEKLNAFKLGYKGEAEVKIGN